MEFEKFINEIVNEINNHVRLLSELERLEMSFYHDDGLYIKLQVLKDKVAKSSNKCVKYFLSINDLYSLSVKHNYFYFDCPLQVYISHFNKRFEEFKTDNIDADLIDFIRSEVSIFNNPKKNRILTAIKEHEEDRVLSINYSNYFNSNFDKYTISFNKKINFLSEKIKQFGYKIIIQEPDEIYNQYLEMYEKQESYIYIVELEKDDLPVNQIQSNSKLKVNLSVPELALLFKMLNDLKPNVFEKDSDADLLRFISTNFQTKKSSNDGISTNKLRNLFSTPDYNSIEFWEKHLHTMLSNIRKLK